MNLNVSAEIADIVEQAVAASVQRSQFYVGVEHLFAAILDRADQLPEKVRQEWLNHLLTALREVNRLTWQAQVASASGDIVHTPRAIKALTQAGKIAQRSGQGARAGHLLLAILSDGLSAPSRAMDRLGRDRGACLVLLRQELNVQPAPAMATPGRSEPAPAAAVPGTAATPPNGAGLETLTRNLSDKARRGELHPAIGRDEEILQVLQVLTRKTKNNVMLVGEAGVGKTQLVEGLALAMARCTSGPRYEVLELNLAALMAGTQYRGAFEEKLLGLIENLKRSPDTVLFIDEVHVIMGAGSTDGDSMDFANLLKPVLARGEIRCIGATTVQEYRRFVEKDPALERRFQMVRVEELSEEATLQVLLSLRLSLERHHGILIDSRSLQASIALTQRHLPNLRLPDKAIDVLDQA
ncbi:MAG: ATP-dependent Clp protease ATP-binding subunit, partial [Candidatus Hydrogenedentes bacterium]|nr:ATP-dependent Clp protease ATP-binding subunit [Candidatus Hydrogenedentota bacterium]